MEIEILVHAIYLYNILTIFFGTSRRLFILDNRIYMKCSYSLLYLGVRLFIKMPFFYGILEYALFHEG